MRLTIAEGSRGHYRVDSEGRVYTRRLFETRPRLVALGCGPKPGERPDPKRYGTPYWLPTGQVEERSIGLYTTPEAW